MLLGKDREMMNTLLGESKGLGRIAQRYRYNSDPDRMYKDYALTQQQQALQGLKGKIPEEVMQMYQAGMLPPDAIGNMMGFGGSDAPANVREWNHYSQLPQDQQRQYLEMKRASQMMNLGNQFAVRDPVSNQAAPIPGGQIQLGPNETLPYRYGSAAAATQGTQDVRATTEPGIRKDLKRAEVLGQAEAEREVNAPKEALKAGFDTANVDRIIGDVDKAIEDTGVFTAGVLGSMLRGVPGTPAKDLGATLETIKANLGFDRLQAMRDASPTGGALGQVAIQELVALQASVANLDQAQSPDQLAKNLLQIQNHYNNWKGLMDKYRESSNISTDTSDGWGIVP